MPHGRFAQMALVQVAVGLLVLGSPALAAPPTAAQINQSRIAGLAWLMSHQERDGSWKLGEASSLQSTSAVLDAFANAGVKQGFPYAAGLAFLTNAEASSVDALARQIVTLQAAGKNVAPLLARLSEWQNGNAAWGAYKGYGSSLPDTPLALTAQLRANAVNASTVLDTLCDGLLKAQRANASFPYAGGGGAGANAAGALVPTAYAAAALDGVSATFGFSSLSCPTTYVLSTTVSNAVNWILSKQSVADGGFGDFGQSSVLETAIAYLALKQIGPTTYATALGEAQGYLVARQAADGSWASDPFASALALQTLPALATGALADSNANGLPDAVEAFLGRNPNVPGRSIADGNGKSVGGLTASLLVASGTQFQPFSASLVAPAGAAPYTWRLVSGFLPDGLVLAASTGLLSGTPSTSGVFNFVYEVSDSSSAKSQVAAQIGITASETDVPTLPEWGLIVLTLLLAGFLAKQRHKQPPAL
jgi:Putative Ig domain/IPTL-CTERM motif/Prenyltransferase and squalene oxidase repeat